MAGRRMMLSAGAMSLALAMVAWSAPSGAAQRAPSDELRYGFDLSSTFTGNFDPAKSLSNCDLIVTQPIYDTLLHLDSKNQLVPGLVQSWQVAADNLSITLTLRSGVKFQDGEPFDAQAVANGLTHNASGSESALHGTIGTVDVTSPTTLVVHLTPSAQHDATPNSILYGLTGRDGEIIAPNAMADANSHPVGAGPFSFSSYSAGSSLQLTRFTGYYAASSYKLGGINYTQVGVGPPSVTALEAGSIDYTSFSPESYSSVKSTPGIAVLTHQTNDYLQLQFRINAAPFNNVLLRQAVSYAINKSVINAVVNAGLGTVATEPLRPGDPGYNRSVANLYPYNPAKARQLLARAGKPHGFSFEMVAPAGVTASQREAVLIQQQLAQVGITAKIVSLNPASLPVTYYIQKQGSALAASTLADPYPPHILYDTYSVGSFVGEANGTENPQVSNLLLQAFANPAQANALVGQAVKIVMTNAYEVPIAFTPQLAAYRTSAIGGPITAQPDVCRPPNLAGVFVKK